MPEPTPTYSPGLEGVIAGESAICAVDPGAGLLYRGYDVHDLATLASFEEVVWLLLRGELPAVEQYEALREDLAELQTLPEAVVAMLKLLPPDAAPIDALRTGVSMLGSFDPEAGDLSHDANVRKAVRLVAQLSSLVTTGWRVAHGQEPLTAGTHLTHAARFLFSLTGQEPEPWQSVAFNTVLILYAEHDFNASTFSARVTASTLADMYAAITSAIGTLKGPLHGGANEAAMRMLQEIGSPDRAEAWAMERLGRKQKLMGFGHRVYREGDTRVPAVRALCQEMGRRLGQEHWAQIAGTLETVMQREKRLYANLDLYAAPVLHMLGVPTDLATPVFACARVSGWSAHVIEQQDHNRLIRPRSLYTGPGPRPYHAPHARPA